MKIAMKITIAAVLVLVTAFFGLHVGRQSHHFVHGQESGPVTISIREGDGSLCIEPVFQEYYQLTVKAFAAGPASVDEEKFRQDTFDLMKTSDFFGDLTPEQIVDHIKDIPGQLIQIIREDASVLENCENLSIALIGPV